MQHQSWRTLNTADREEFFGWLDRIQRERNAVGRETHGDVFIGEPLDKAIEEAMDLLFYLWAEKRKQKATIPAPLFTHDVYE